MNLFLARENDAEQIWRNVTRYFSNTRFISGHNLITLHVNTSTDRHANDESLTLMKFWWAAVLTENSLTKNAISPSYIFCTNLPVGMGVFENRPS